jgi:uncharacterized protein (AIM24 family)
MSTLVAQTISNGTVSTSSANVIQGSAKAWVNFDGTGTVAIRASYNVSSITDNGTGDYTVNFTTAFADTNYAAVVTSNALASSVVGGTGTTSSTTALQVLSVRPGVGYQDSTTMSVSVFR